MGIHNYLGRLEGNGKRHIVLIVTPKEKYPITYLDKEYYWLEEAILKAPKSYMSLYGDDPNEIMQFVAFREYIRPVIGDKYQMSSGEKQKLKRATRDDIISFIVATNFYDKVPSGEKTESESIEEGLLLANDFLEKFPLDRFEHVLVKLRKDSDEANVLINISFENKSDSYYFERVYVH